MSELPSSHMGGTKVPRYAWTKTEEGLLLEVMESLGEDEMRPHKYIKRGEIVTQMGRLVKERNLSCRVFRARNASLRRDAMVRYVPMHLLQARTTIPWTDIEKALFAETLDWKKSTPKITWVLFAIHMNQAVEARGLNCRRFSGTSCSTHWRNFHKPSSVDARADQCPAQQGPWNSLPSEEAAPTDAEWGILTGFSTSMDTEYCNYNLEDLETQMNGGFGESALTYGDVLTDGLENVYSSNGHKFDGRETGCTENADAKEYDGIKSFDWTALNFDQFPSN